MKSKHKNKAIPTHRVIVNTSYIITSSMTYHYARLYNRQLRCFIFERIDHHFATIRDLVLIMPELAVVELH